MIQKNKFARVLFIISIVAISTAMFSIPVSASHNATHLQHQLNKSYSTNPGEKLTLMGVDPDYDNDGVVDVVEFTNRNSSALTNDTDKDNLEDGREHALGTNAGDADSDNDTIPDGKEKKKLQSNPLSIDTDSDGLEDSNELRFSKNPTENDVIDTDNDGLVDVQEKHYGTDVTAKDTDKDSYTDSEELANETSRGVKIPNADPLRRDIYVVFIPGPESNTHSEDVKQGIKFAKWKFADLNITNPDGSKGINFHAIQSNKTISDPINTIDEMDQQWRRDKIKQKYLGEKRHSYLLGIVTEKRITDDGSNLDGIAYTGGRVFTVESENAMQHVIFHEILHNIIGELEYGNVCGETHYCESGGNTAYLSDKAKLNKYMNNALKKEFQEQFKI